jgi:hemin uptake protein HemP
VTAGHDRAADEGTGAAAAPPSSGGRPVVWSNLFRAEREILIVRRGEGYRLRITRADKLILTK